MLRGLEKAGNVTRSKKGIIFWATRTLIFGAVTYGTVLSALLIFENQLVFPGAPQARGNWTPTQFEFEEVAYQAEDGTKLVGWYLEKNTDRVTDGDGNGIGFGKRKEPLTVLVFHGNAENVAQSAARVGSPLQKFLDANVMVAEYRGYGKSNGSTTESGILQDAEAALKWLCQRTGKSPAEIVLFGHSLGGGPACYLAGKNGCRALVLDRTFDSLASTAQNLYPIFPVKLLMRNPMRSDLWIQNFDGPVYIAHGDCDTLIPLNAAQNLFSAAPAKTKKLMIHRGWGHWDAFPQGYWADMASFLDEVLKQH